MIYGYIRISTDKQTEDNQKYKILEYCNTEGFKIDDFVSEQISTRVAKNDREITKLIKRLKKGDMIITTELSRLGRASISEIGYFINIIQDQKAGLICICDNIKILPEKEMDIPTQAMISAIALACRIERDMISERTKNALAARKASGVKLGRPKGNSKLEPKKEEIKSMLLKGINKTAISKMLNVSRNTLFLYINNTPDLREINKKQLDERKAEYQRREDLFIEREKQKLIDLQKKVD